MAIAYIGNAGVTDEEYRRVADEALGESPPEGHMLHLSGKDGDGRRWVVDIWEEAEAAQRFERERLLPAFERHGISSDGAPTVVELDVLRGTVGAD